MKWRSVDEKPKRNGDYYLCYTTAFSKEVRFQYSNFETDRFSLMADIICWLDPEVPEHFLKSKAPEEKVCPWCKQTNWTILSHASNKTCKRIYWFTCYTETCSVRGPEAPSSNEAEAAIFERVR